MGWGVGDRVVHVVDVAEVDSAAVLVAEAELLSLRDGPHLGRTDLRKPDMFVGVEDILREVDQEQLEVEVEGHVGQRIELHRIQDQKFVVGGFARHDSDDAGVEGGFQLDDLASFRAVVTQVAR